MAEFIAKNALENKQDIYDKSEAFIGAKNTFILYEKYTGEDLTPYLVHATWSGSLGSAARKLDFSLATSQHDNNFNTPAINATSRVQLNFIDNNSITIPLFNGHVFTRNYTSNSNAIEFTAYDDLVYMAKSHMTYKFNKLAISDCIEYITRQLGVNLGEIPSECYDIYADFIADDLSGSEILEKLYGLLRAKTGLFYNAFMRDYGEPLWRMHIVNSSAFLDSCRLTANTNIISADHSESTESMINQICIVNKYGDILGYLINSDDRTNYGLLQAIYKVNDKKNTQEQASALLKPISIDTNVNAIGDINCITGFSIPIEINGIAGNFLITDDSHEINNNNHNMSLKLSYLGG